MKKIIARLLIMMMVLGLSLGTVYATTGAEPGTRITRVGLAVGLYGSKYREKRSEQAATPAESGQSGAEKTHVVASTRVKASDETAVEALVQSYTPEEGVFELNDESRFFIASGNKPTDEMITTVRLMSAQFASLKLPTEKALPVLYAEPANARDGDIVLKVVDETNFNPGVDSADVSESYKLEIGKTAQITACSTDGIYYGLITLMEMAAEKSDGDNKITMDCCTISDGPDIKERTIFLDCGRKYFSRDWIENLIKRASLQRYNSIELHFSEAEGLRFDSVEFPWLTDGIDSLSREDMAEIIKTARTYHMEVIPSIDTPGHNQYMIERYESYVKEHPDWYFTYDDKKYNSDIKNFGSIANYYSHKGDVKKANYLGIDLTSEHAVAFSNALIDDYADFFKKHGCKKFNIGGDELMGWYSESVGGKNFGYENRWEALEHWENYARKTLKIENGSASDTFINYINTVAERLENQGYRCRMFNDEININDDQHIKLNKSVDVIMWAKQAENYSSIIDAGHSVHIDQEYDCFYVVRELNGSDIMNNRYSSVNAEHIYDTWNPCSFVTKSGYIMTPAADQLAGAYFNIWCDHPDYKDEETIWKETEMRTWANASKMWNVQLSTNESGLGEGLKYGDFESFTKKLQGFPGYQGNPNKPAELVSPTQLINGNSALSRWFG